MKKRTVALLLATAVTVTTLSGCGAKSAESAANTSGYVLESVEEAPACVEATCEEPLYEAADYETSDYEVSGNASSSYADSDYEVSSSEAYASEAYVGTTGTMLEATTADTERGNEASYNSAAAMKQAATNGYGIETEDCGYWDEFECTDTYNRKNNGETYNEVVENNFTEVAVSPLSTFGADVDTASYSNFRRMVEDGYRLRDIPRGSIRAEEMINYFSYNYAGPKKGEPFGVNATITDCPWNKKTKLVTLGIKAKDIQNPEKVASNIVFLVDVSGSMNSYDKLPLLQMGFEMLIDNLDENDRVSIVTYASDSDIVLSGVTGDKKSELKKAMNDLRAMGSTNGGSGIKKAYKLAEKYFIEGGNNRIIMATDGDLNVGITSESELEKLVTKKKESGVFLSVLGLGTGNYNEAKLETLADKGNGNYSYVDSLKEAKKVLVDEFNSTLFTIAKDVKFQLEFNPQYVKSYRQIGYENRAMAAQDFNDDTKDGGEIGAGHTVTVMYEVELNDGEENESGESNLRYQSNSLTNLAVESGEWMTVSIRYKDPDEDTSKLLSYPVSKECYTKKPSCDTLFATYVAELAMILNNSEYADRIDLDDIIDGLNDIELDDEYKAEFLDLVEML